ITLHKELSEFIIPRNFYNELEKTLQKNINVGYMHLQTNTLDESSWVPLLPGFNEPTIIAILQNTVRNVYKKDSVVSGIKLEENGKCLSPKSTQALIQLQDESSNLNNNIDQNENFERIRKEVDNILDEKKLGSTMLISFNVTIDVNCQLCDTMDSYSNQSKGVNFSHLVAAVILAGGINHYAMQIVLVVIGITTQSCKRSYHQYQSQMFSEIILSAKESARQAFNAAIAYANTKEKKVLTIGIDYS
ncbi:3711_t:CDS:2, partial [Funneliformis caledonium]